MLFSIFVTFAGACLAAPSSPLHRRQYDSPLSTNYAQALYFMSNKASGNTINAVQLATDGTITGNVTSYATGGVGGAITLARPGYGVLASQGSVTVAGSKLYIVNAGSNTLSLFNISCDDPTTLIRRGDPMDTLGDFPTSVTASSIIDTACVANTGASAGITCFGLNQDGLVPLDSSQRSVTLPGGAQTNPPSGPLNTISAISFNGDLSQLLVVVKSDQYHNGSYMLSYPVVNGGMVTTTPVQSDPGLTIPGAIFPFNATAGYTLGIADRLSGIILLDDLDGSYSTVADIHELHYSFAAQDPITDFGIATSGPYNTVLTFDPTTRNTTVSSPLSSPVTSLGETVAANNLIYSLSYGTEPGNQYIVVMSVADCGTVTVVQEFALTNMTGRVSGLAAFIPGEIDTQCVPDIPLP